MRPYLQYIKEYGITPLQTLIEYREALLQATIQCPTIIRNIDEQIRVLLVSK